LLENLQTFRFCQKTFGKFLEVNNFHPYWGKNEVILIVIFFWVDFVFFLL